MGDVTLFLLCCFVGFLPFELLAYFGDLPSGAKLLGALVVASAIVAILTGQRMRLLSAALTVRFALVAWTCLSLLWSVSPEITFSTIYRHLQLTLFVLVLWEFAVKYEQQLWLLRAYLLGMLVPLAMQYAALAGLYQIDTDDDVERISGGGHDLNYLAGMYAISILISVYLASNSTKLDRRLRPFYWMIAVLAVPGVFLTGSKGGLVCLLTAIPFALITCGVSLRRALRLSGYSLIIAVLGFLVVYIVPAATLSRSFDVSSHSDTFLRRAEFWQRGFTWGFLPHPITGIGSGTYTDAISAASGIKTGVAHNVGIELLVELGVVGFALYAVFIWLLVRACWRMPWREKTLWLGVLCVEFFMAMAVGNDHSKLDWFLHVMVLAQAAALTRSVANRRSRPVALRAVPVAGRPLPPDFRRS